MDAISNQEPLLSCLTILPILRFHISKAFSLLKTIVKKKKYDFDNFKKNFKQPFEFSIVNLNKFFNVGMSPFNSELSEVNLIINNSLVD
jgi:hypothetical protein